MARTKQTARKYLVYTEEELAWRVKAGEQIQSWRTTQLSPTHDGLLARLRARIFGSPRLDAAPPFDILAECSDDIRALIFSKASVSAMARLALASKSWSALIAHALPDKVDHDVRVVNGLSRYAPGLAEAVRAVAAQQHPCELVSLVQKLQPCLSKMVAQRIPWLASVGTSDGIVHGIGLAVAHCRSPTEWTPELLLELHRSFLWEPNDKHCHQPSGEVLSRFLRPVVSGGGFASEERLLSLARSTYIQARELEMSLIVDYYCGFWPACGVGQMEKLALYVAHEPSRWPVQSVLYMLQMAIECYDGDDGQWEALLAAFYSKWAPAVDFPSAWKSEEVATFFERWCAAMREDAGFHDDSDGQLEQDGPIAMWVD